MFDNLKTYAFVHFNITSIHVTVCWRRYFDPKHLQNLHLLIKWFEGFLIDVTCLLILAHCGRGPPKFFLIGILLFLLLGSPRKKLEPYDKPFWNIFENSIFSGQNRVNMGGRGGPRNLFFIEILLILVLRSPCKIS